MAVQDWTRVAAGPFHHFHRVWIANLSSALNLGHLPSGIYAMSEQVSGGPIPDVLTLQHTPPQQPAGPDPNGGVAIAEAPPKAWAVIRAEEDIYAARADRIVIRNPFGEVVAIIEIVSPGNKGSRAAIRSFVEKAADFLRKGVHLLIVDLFPPGPRDPQGIHPVLWGEFAEELFELPPGRPLTIASYAAGPVKTAYVEPIAVGDPLPPMPLFLSEHSYVPAPLEETYQQTWASCPEPLREAVSGAF
jgi:hypothetical protein